MQKAIETNNGLKGGFLKGKAHYDSNGNPLGGIKAVVTDQGGKPIEVEGSEVIINKKTVQSDKVLTVKGTPKEILSTLNQMDGNGVAIGDEEAEILAKYRTGGELIKRADGSYSRRGLWDNIRDNVGSGRKPTKQMLEQEAKIKSKYHLGGDMTKHLAPNGNPSKLTHEQWHLVRTPEFKSWFGDFELAYETLDYDNVSKVIDENGEPLIVYHNSESKFNIFDKSKNKLSLYGEGIYFTNIKNEYISKGKNLYEVFLCLKEPFFIDFENKNKEVYIYKNQEFDIDEILRQKRDIEKGAIIRNPPIRPKDKNYFIGERTYYIAGEPNQIKLADGTNTTFDTKNPDIRFADGGSILLAPNGKPSKLTPEQYKLVRSSNFKNWFGDWENDPEKASKVVDENGEPLVVYHGTKNKNINTFNNVNYNEIYEYDAYGIYSSESIENAKHYSGDKGNVISIFVDIKNPYNLGTRETDKGRPTDKNLRAIAKERYEFYIEKGYDGVIFTDLRGIMFEIVALYPNQIKLADGTNTTFDGNNDDIRFSEGGSISKMTPSELKAFYNSKEGKKLDAQTYSEWDKLVNMTKSELEKFYNSVEGKKAGLTTSQAKEQGIDSGRESARWIMKMKDIPYKKWSSDMWRWAKKQINFIKRMSGMKGRLYDDKGEKTRKHTALLIWGHNPESKGLRRFKGGGELSKKALAVETNDLTDFVRKYFIKDGRIDVADAMQELFGNKGDKSIADEYRKRIGLHKKGGLTISQLAHNLWEEHKDEVREGIDDSDFRNAVEEVLISEYGVSSMIKSLMDKSEGNEQDRESEYWMSQYNESDDEYYEDLSDEEVADYFKDMEGFERELAKGTEHEMEHLDTLKKVAEHKITPEEAVVQTAKTHIKENPNYYEDLAKMELEALKDKLKSQGYNVTIPSGGNRISVMGYGKGYFNAKKQKADSILSSLKRNGYNAVSKLDADGYYDFWVYADEPKQDLAKMEKENEDSMDFDFSSLFEPSESVNDTDNDLILSEEQKKEEAYQKSSFDKKWASTRKEAIEKLLKQYFEAENSYKDWSSRQYKQNKSAVFLGGDDIYGQSKSIGAINEGRKQKALKRAESLMKESITDLKEIGLSVSEIDNLIKKDKQAENEESIPDLIEGLKVLADSLEGAEKKEIEDVIEGLEILLESDNKIAEGGGIEAVLWATKIGEPDWNEQIITENASQIEDAKKWALANGFDRLRVSRIDMSSKPDFTKGFKKYAEGGQLEGNTMIFEPSKADQDQEKRIMENQFGKNI